MPAILTRELESEWINQELKDKKEIIEMLKPYNAKEMEAHKVSSIVNSVANNNPACITPA